MRNAANPFTDPGQVRGALYASADRIAQRTGALHRARVTGRHAGEVDAVARELRAGNVPGNGLMGVAHAQRPLAGADGPAAFYKDANPRNFLITPDGLAVTVDFDDLTLAPFGYDLAKLVVTLAMTYGALPGEQIAAALYAYNIAAARQCAALPGVTWAELMNWAEIHHILTSRYAADGRYRRRWHEVRSYGSAMPAARSSSSSSTAIGRNMTGKPTQEQRLTGPLFMPVPTVICG